jgi:iron complex outermembrane receptor protein
VYSPFTPEQAGGAGAPLPPDVAVLWPALVAVLAEQGVDLSDVPHPAPGQIAGELRLLDVAAGGFVPVEPRDLAPIVPHERTITDALEVGYRGVIGERVVVGVDVYRNRISDLLGRIFAATPNLFAGEASLRSYLADFLPPDAAAAVAAAAAGIPLATASSERFASPDILLFRRQGGDVTLWGADLEVTAELASGLSATASYSWVSDDSISAIPAIGDFVLSAPASKGSLSLTYRDPERGWEGRLQGRAVASFPVESGVYRGRVESYEVVDLYGAWRLPWRGNLELALDVQNVLGDRHREYVGAPDLGRLVLARLRATL